MEKTLSQRMEDYLRCIYEIVERKGFARIKDIAEKMDLQPSSIVEMMRKLKENGYVNYEKYGGVTLTTRGQEIAEAIEERHDIFRKLLGILMVPEDVASKDSHILEHQLDPKTILQFTRFVNFILESSERPGVVGRVLEHFKEYCGTLEKEPS
jgi:DtxR family Mn-dependent transcriptional regulator